MLGEFLLVIYAILCFAALYFFLRYYGLKIRLATSNLYEIAILVFSYIPIFMGVSVASYEVSKNFSSENASPNTFLLVIQYFLYYITMIISFFVNPFLTEFNKITSEKHGLSILERSKKALLKLIIYYGILLGLLVIGLISILVSGVKINISVILGILPSILNLYGLIMYLFAIGFSLAKIPLELMHRALPVNILRDNLIEIENISQDKTNDDPAQTQHFQNLLSESKIEYENIIQLNVRRNPKKILYCGLMYLLSLVAFSFSILHIVNECSYGYRNSPNKFVLHSILASINNEIGNQLFLFLYISIVVSFIARILTYINFKSVIPDFLFNIFVKAFNIMDYKFTKGDTSSKTFEHWSTYLQRLVPTLAYHCQCMAGVQGTSLERLFGQLSHFDIFTALVKVTFPSFLLLIFIFIIIFALFEESYDKNKVREGLRKLKMQMNYTSGPDLDTYIIDNEFNINQINRNAPKNETNNDITIQLSSFSSFHNATESNEQENTGVLN